MNRKVMMWPIMVTSSCSSSQSWHGLVSVYTPEAANPKFIMLQTPSPRTNPLATIITSTFFSASFCPVHLLIHHHEANPPMTRARVNEGVLYIPKLVLSGNEKYQRRQLDRKGDIPSAAPSMSS